MSPEGNPNVAAQLAERVALHPERTAIVEYSGGRAAPRRITFGGLAERVAGLGAGMREAGVGAGDRVLLFVPMSIDLYVALLATLHAGATAVFLDAWAGRERLDAAIAAARPKAFVGSPRAHLLRLASPAVRAIPLKWVAGRRWLRLERYERPPSGPPAAVAPDHPALVTFTTGSTGRPKGAARSHAFLWAQHRALAAHLRLAEEDVDMPTLPVFVLNNLASGTTSVVPDFDPRRPAEIDPAKIFRQMSRERVTTTSGSPAFYERLAGWCAQRGLRVPARALFTGGAPVYPPLARLLADTVAGEAHVVYGSTEAEPVAGIEARAMLAAMRDGGEGICVGPPVPEVDLRIVRPHDGPIELGPGGWAEWDAAGGETGEVVVTGDHVLAGYLDALAADRENKVRDGARVWHRTGDAARVDTEGRLWLMGRVSQRVERAGETWWSTPAEVRALDTPGVRHAAYLGIPDLELGQRAVLCVETEGGRLGEAERAALLERLAPIPVDELRVLARIPRDPRHASKTHMAALYRLLQRDTP
ncbi:MAG TPA: AMP-binding protein [Longimicrobiaceae bacterium]|nr:AMP-binding protein [Longimicrobiaceae bacterium]